MVRCNFCHLYLNCFKAHTLICIEAHCTGLPINDRIPMSEPGKPKYNFFWTKTGDVEFEFLFVFTNLNGQVYFMGDTSGFIECSIDIMKTDGVLQWNLPHLLAVRILFVDEEHCCS